MKTTKTLFGIITITTALAVQTKAQTFLTDGLVAYYPYSGNANDASRYSNNPVANTATLTSDRLNAPTSAYGFSGIEEIEYADQPQLDTTTNLTVSCWIQTTNIYGGFHGLVCKATPTNPWIGYQLGVDQNFPEVQVDLSVFTGTNVINDGRWHSVCAVIDHQIGQVQIFVDGKIDSTFSTPAATLISQYPLLIGVERQSVGFFAGSIDEVRIYNSALSGADVQQLYQYESAAQVTLLKAVVPAFSNLTLGTNYQLQTSSDLNIWTNQGIAFTATNSAMTYQQYFQVSDWNALYFRLQVAP